MKVEPSKEHAWLAQLAGDWTFEAEATMEPGKEPEKVHGTHQAHMLGGVWLLGEGEMPGGDVTKTLMTLGFDPARQRFVGSFIGSMMTHMWLYEGSLDAASKVLTLDTEGPSFTGDGKMAKYQDIIEVLGPDHHTLSSRSQGADGQWHHFMTAHYRRKK